METLSSSSSSYSGRKINEVAVYINTKLHEQAKVLISEFHDSLSRYHNLNLNDFVNNLDPSEADLVCKLPKKKVL